MSKFVVIMGGVISGTGKGIAIASIGFLLTLRGLKVTAIKCDPYLNVNAGVLNPREHGEVFLCDDGSETDLDLGSYERLIGCEVSKKNILTSGTIYKELIDEQEQGKYLGQTVQVVPHVTDKILKKLEDLAKDVDVVLVEVGGTVGDVESTPFLEAIRQLKQNNYNDTLIALCAPILWINTIKEFKTKPLQQSVQTMQSSGLQPDIILCRTDREIPQTILDKISNLTNVSRGSVFEAPDVSTIYEVPIEFYNRHIDDLIIDKFHFKRNGVKIHKYKDLVEKYVNSQDLPEINIGILGKYENCDEAYLSLKEAVFHAAVNADVRVNIKWIQSQELEGSKDMRGVWKHFENLHGLIVPGGFDSRGVEGKIKGIAYARSKKIPFLGICLGLQCAMIEFSRNVLGKADANSQEFNLNSSYPIVHYMQGQENIQVKSASMRLGAFDCEIKKDTLAFNLYKKKVISERHRHRLEVNGDLISDPIFREKGLTISGKHPITNLVEIVELDQTLHPFFIATQAHPEFKSRLTNPSPLFLGLIEAAKQYQLNNSEPKIQTPMVLKVSSND